MLTRVLIENGKSAPGFTLDDRIFLGEGLFETIRVNSSMPCYSDLHWQRMRLGAEQLGIPFDLSFDVWQEHLVRQIKRDNVFHGGIKVILSGGSAPRGLTEQGQVSQLMFQTFNYPVQNNPIRLLSAPWFRDGANPIYQLKSINYLEAILARRQAIAQGFDDVLFFNTKYHATETTCANLFLIKDDTVFTPLLTDGVLKGVTRTRLIAHCIQDRIPYIECSITKDMIKEAQVVFLTNSLQGIRLVKSFDDYDFEISHPLIEQLTQLIS